MPVLETQMFQRPGWLLELGSLLWVKSETQAVPAPAFYGMVCMCGEGVGGERGEANLPAVRAELVEG